MEETLKRLIDVFEDADEETKQKVLHILSRNEAMEVVYTETSDSFGVIYVTDCPACGNNLKFERYSQVSAPYNYCYHCGQKLNKKV